MNPSILNFTVFVVLLIASAVVLASLVVRLCARLLQESPLRRALPVGGLMLGGVRGLWWAGVLLLVVLATEQPYLTTSITQRSRFSPRLVKVTQHSLRWMTDRFPGHDHHAALIPYLSAQEPSARQDRRMATLRSGHAAHP